MGASKMNILIINNEKDKYDYGWLPDLKKKILEIVDAEFIVKHFTEASNELIKQFNIDFVILSGRVNSNWGINEEPLFYGEYDLIKNCRVPLLGICAGLQLIGTAYGIIMDYICTEKREDVNEKGYFEIDILEKDKIFFGISSPAMMYEQHYCEIKGIPEGFVHLASSKITPIQCIKDKNRNLYGVQFHPEKYSKEFPHGKIFLENFFSLR